jgi:hypothetical protein
VRTTIRHSGELSRLDEATRTSIKKGRKWVETRLAEIVTLDNLGTNPTEFEVNLGTKKPGEHLPFEHVFDPEGATPPPMF